MDVSASNDRVVVGVKDGPESVAAAEWAVHEAAARQVMLVVVHGFTYPVSDQPLSAETVALIEKAAHRVVDDVLGKLTIPATLEVGRVVQQTAPARLLTDMSRHSALVVLGRDRLTTFERITQGATTAEVCARSSCPTIVVPAGLRPGGERQPIIVAVDGLASAAPALQLGFDTAARWSLPLRVLHAGDEHDSPEDLQDRRRTVEELLAGWKAADPDVAVEVDVVQGRPVEAIRDHAEHAQLMIVGRAHEHRLGSWGRSVASAVLDHCRCPLAVVPESPLPDLGTRASVASEEALSVTP